MNPFILFALPLVTALSACAPVGTAWRESREASMAADQIMLVRQTPATFGWQRIRTLSARYPDLQEFFRQTGSPDFLAETQSEERRYLILYYLDRRQAYACRTKNFRSREVEFSGPYPITPAEHRTLKGFRKQREAF